MNSKKNNYFIGITNVIFIVSLYLIYIIYNKYQINLLLTNYISEFENISFIVIGFINIICGIINRKNKDISFWQVAFGILEIMHGINYIFIDKYSNEIWSFLYESLPIIFVLFNIFKSIKNKKIKAIEIICYIGIIIISILEIRNIIKWYWYIWSILVIIMQFIAIHKQENYIENKKIFNILFDIIQSIFTIGFFILIIVSTVQTKFHENQIDENRKNICSEIVQLKGTTIEETYIPVKKDDKYGYINNKGEEKIPCQYDFISYFINIEIENNNYDIALVTQEDDIFIINKNNQKLNVNKYIQFDERKKPITPENVETNKGIVTIEDIDSIKIGGTTAKLLNSFNLRASYEILAEKEDHYRWLNLRKTTKGYTYEFENYIMNLDYIEGENYSTPLYTEIHELDENETNEMSTDKTKFKVTIKKRTGEETSSIENIIGYSLYNPESIQVFTNGFVEFENPDGTEHGFYDENGNKFKINIKYTIMDVIDNKIILRKKTEERNQETIFLIVDKNNKNSLLKSKQIYMAKDLYIIKDEKNKMALYDKDLKAISNNYDMICVR